MKPERINVTAPTPSPMKKWLRGVFQIIPLGRFSKIAGFSDFVRSAAENRGQQVRVVTDSQTDEMLVLVTEETQGHDTQGQDTQEKTSLGHRFLNLVESTFKAILPSSEER